MAQRIAAVAGSAQGSPASCSAPARLRQYGWRGASHPAMSTRCARCEAAASDGVPERPLLGAAETAEAREATMLEYLELKQYLLQRTRRAGYFLTAYLLLAYSAEAALCAAVGSAASYLYMTLLCREIDNLSPNDEVPMARANQLPPGPQRAVSRFLAGLQQQARPRLLVPVALGLGIYLYNSQTDDPLTLAEEASVFGGFLSFKIAHVMYVYQQLRPRFGEKKVRKRPTFDAVADVAVDMYGRAKAQPRAVEDADRALAEEEARETERARR